MPPCSEQVHEALPLILAIAVASALAPRRSPRAGVARLRALLSDGGGPVLSSPSHDECAAERAANSIRQCLDAPD